MNNGNGNGDLNGGIFGGPDVPGADIPGPADLPGFDKPGSDIPGPGDYPGIDKGLGGRFNIELEGYTPPPDPLPSSVPSEPSRYEMDNLNKAFSPAEPQVSEPSKGKTLGEAVDKFAQWGITMSKFGPYGLIGAFFDLFGKACIGITGALGMNDGKGHTPGGLIDQGLAALGLGEVQLSSGKGLAPSGPGPSPRGTTITMSPDGYTEKISAAGLESVLSFSPAQKAPSSYPSYYGGSAYPALSMSLFQAKENGGLMIFPTSGGAIEPEMSSLVKKQEPVIDTPSLLFLMGMGLLGVVLRGKR
jgi:hypothetical protein